MPRWNLPFLLREAQRAGAGLAVLLQSHDHIRVIRGLREAFGLDLTAAMRLVESADRGDRWLAKAVVATSLDEVLEDPS
jgi:hypothetical protein